MAEASPEPVHFSAARCESCGRVVPDAALEEGGWCPECRERRTRRLGTWPHVIAGLIVLPFAVWVLVLDKSAFLPWYAWLVPLAAAYYLGFRIGREAVKGYLRMRRDR